MNLLIAPKVHTKSGVDLLSGSREEIDNAKSLTDGQTYGRWTTRHGISSPGPKGPGELIIIIIIITRGPNGPEIAHLEKT